MNSFSKIDVIQNIHIYPMLEIFWGFLALSIKLLYALLIVLMMEKQLAVAETLFTPHHPFPCELALAVTAGFSVGGRAVAVANLHEHD